MIFSRQKTLYFNIFPPFLVDGSYGNWSLNTTCTVTCGQGLERWSRECNNSEPKYGGRNCSHLGEPVEYRPCSAKPCPGKVTFGKKMPHGTKQLATPWFMLYFNCHL